MPLRTAMTPAIVVVLTAPSPTSRMPTLPSAEASVSPLLTGKDYIKPRSPGACEAARLQAVERRRLAGSPAYSLEFLP
jgi:hypothetical protein